MEKKHYIPLPQTQEVERKSADFEKTVRDLHRGLCETMNIAENEPACYVVDECLAEFLGRMMADRQWRIREFTYQLAIGSNDVSSRNRAMGLMMSYGPAIQSLMERVDIGKRYSHLPFRNIDHLVKSYRQNVRLKALEGELVPPYPDFETALREEEAIAGPFLDTLDDLLRDEECGPVAHELYRKQSRISRRVFCTPPVILENPFDGSSKQSHPKLFSFVVSKHGKMPFRFGFIEHTLADADGDYKIIQPFLAISGAVIDAVGRYGDDPMIASILPQFRHMATLANHDYVHSCVFTPPRLATDYDYRSPTRGAFPVRNAPLNRPPYLESMNNLGQSLTTSLEPFSQALHLDVMERLFKREPEMKRNVLAQGLAFIDSVDRLAIRMRESGDPGQQELAPRLSEYLIQNYMRRMFTFLPPFGSVFKKPVPYDPAERSFETAINAALPGDEAFVSLIEGVRGSPFSNMHVMRLVNYRNLSVPPAYFTSDYARELGVQAGRSR